MKSLSFCAAFALSLCFAGVLSAQQTNVCVVDVATVFKSHAGFNQQLEALKQEAEQYKSYLETKAAEFQKMAEELKTLDVNSDAYVQLESRMARARADVEIERRNKTREFVQREARLHFDTYVQTTHAVASLCQERGVRLVLQYSSIPMTLENPQTIMQRVNSEIVFFAPRKDLTNDIIARMPQGGERTGSVPSTNR